jgi:RimJ/RimL family protein N-acetyltransferase
MAKPRTATADDLAAMIDLARAMHNESPRFRRYAFLGYRLRTTLEAVLNMGPRGCLLVVEHEGQIVGAFVGLATEHFACDVLQAGDLGLFIAPEHRGGTTAARLVRGYLDWAASIQAEPTISINTGVAVDRTGKLLELLGATQSGTNWTWGI